MTLRHTLAAIAAITAATAPAQEWIDTSTADNFMTLGARIGFNTSNATRDKEPALTNLDSWGTGFDAGVVVSLNFLNCVSVQPGFFFESRSHNYSYIAPSGSTVLPFNVHEYGHTRHTTFKVPVMGQFVTNPAEGLRWSFDFGPCFTYRCSTITIWECTTKPDAPKYGNILWQAATKPGHLQSATISKPYGTKHQK